MMLKWFLIDVDLKPRKSPQPIKTNDNRVIKEIKIRSKNASNLQFVFLLVEKEASLFLTHHKSYHSMCNTKFKATVIMLFSDLTISTDMIHLFSLGYVL